MASARIARFYAVERDQERRPFDATMRRLEKRAPPPPATVRPSNSLRRIRTAAGDGAASKSTRRSARAAGDVDGVLRC